MKIDEKAKYINLGDWIYHFTYAKIKNGKLELMKFKNLNYLKITFSVKIVFPLLITLIK